MTFRVLAVSALAVLSAVAAGCGNDDAGNSAPEPIVASIPDALAAVEEFYGEPQEYFEVSATLDSVGVVVAVDDATHAEQATWTPADGLVGGPEPIGEASGSTFAADQVAVDADVVFDQLRDELDEPVIIDFAVQGGPDGTVIYDATVASGGGGVLLVLLGPDGTIQGVQSE